MQRFVRGTRVPRFVVVALAITFLVSASQQIANAIVTEEVRLDIPIALDGEVWAVEQVGNSVVVGGNFTQVQTERDGPIVDQAGIFAYDLDSGRFIESFRPILATANDAVVEVRDIVPAPDGRSIYIGGRFTTVDDRTDGVARVRNRLALLDVRTGALDRNFAQAGVDALVLSMDIGRNGFLYVGGNFQTVFDLAPGRPPINQEVGGLARFDAATGAFDTTFRYNSQEFIGRTFDGVQTPGVVKVVFNPSKTRLFVAHRGAEIFDVSRNFVRDSPGIARFIIGDATVHGTTEYKLLYPDENDPIQDFFHAEQCGGRGLQIRDMDVANDYLVVVGQGADLGFQCDTATRFSTNGGQHRPDWVSRVFDSVFSVEIDGNDVYIGGHFRYLVGPAAPSPYPGTSVANGGVPADGGEIYVADPRFDADFRNDLVDPGYVFPVGQIGVLDANTGYGDPSWTPVSDAFVGVLEITAVERGLLIGQDQSRINGFLVGRAAFFDDTPDAGRTLCTVALGENDQPVVSWNQIGDVFQFNVAVNGDWLASVDGALNTLADNTANPGETLSYELRYNRNGLSFTEDCGTVERPLLPLECAAVLNGDNEVTVSWNDEGWSRVSIIRNDIWVTTSNDMISFSEELPFGTYSYVVRAFAGSSQSEATCAPSITIEAPVLVCSTTTDGTNLTLEWNDVEAQTYQVFANGVWTAEVAAGGTTFTLPDDGAEYAIRHRLNGQVFDALCQ